VDEEGDVESEGSDEEQVWGCALPYKQNYGNIRNKLLHNRSHYNISWCSVGKELVLSRAHSSLVILHCLSVVPHESGADSH
jgi:hypothetical protein